MATSTYVEMASYTTSGTDTFVNFTNIPTTDVNGNALKDLVLVYDWPSTTGDHYTRVRVNNNSGSIYVSSEIGALNNNPSAYSRTDTYMYVNGAYGNAGGHVMLQIFNYSSSNTFKPVVGHSALDSSLGVGAWSINTTTAVSSIQIDLTGGGTFNAPAVFSLYGIAG